MHERDTNSASETDRDDGVRRGDRFTQGRVGVPDCEVCGEPLKDRRADARHCSGSCRAKASNARRAEAGNVPSDATGEEAIVTRAREDRLIERVETLERLVEDLLEEVAALRQRSSSDVEERVPQVVRSLERRLRAAEEGFKAHSAAIDQLGRNASGVQRVVAVERAVAEVARAQAAMRLEMVELAETIADALSR
jgi:hypothetical protein